MLCNVVNCYVELCAACICDHTEAHNMINTKPKYEHIKNTYQHTNDKLGKLKEAIFHEKNRVVSNILPRSASWIRSEN